MSDLNRNNDKKTNNQSSILTRETLGVVLILFSTLCLVCLISRGAIFSKPGEWISMFLYGTFGFFAIAVMAFTFGLGICFVFDKKSGLPFKKKFFFTLAFCIIALISHVISMHSQSSLSFGEYLKTCYLRGAGGFSTATGGGIITGLVAYVFSSLLTNVGSYVVLSLSLIGVGYAIYLSYKNQPAKSKTVSTSKKFKSSYVPQDENLGVEVSGVKEYPVGGVAFEPSKPAQKLFVNNPEDFSVMTQKEMNKAESPAIKLGLTDGGLNVGNSKTYSASYNEEMKKKIDYVKTPAKIDVEKTISANYSTRPVVSPVSNDENTNVSDYVARKEEPEKEIPFFEYDGNESQPDSAEIHAQEFTGHYADVEEVSTPATVVEEPTENFKAVENVYSEETSFEDEPAVEKESEEIEEIPFVEEPENDSFVMEQKPQEQQPSVSPITNDRRVRDIFFGSESVEQEKEQAKEVPETPAFTSRVSADNNVSRRRGFDFGDMAVEPAPEVEQTKVEKPKPPINVEYVRPPLDLLETYTQVSDENGENHEERKEIIKRTLEEFHINAVPQDYVQGPSITRYEITMPAGISVKKVLGYDDDLRMRLASKDGVRIEAPIPGKNLVGIEVANKVKITVGLKEVIEGMAGKNDKAGSLMFAIGKDIVGNAIGDNLAKGPHYLVAGATGSGKSVCLNVMIVSLIMRYSPEELRLILIDPKRVGFRNYEHIPHLMIDEIITSPKKALVLLQWACDEMERRYDEFAKCSTVVSDIDAYNQTIDVKTTPKMPKIVIIVDELADLMEACKKDMESKILTLAQKSRAAGIHLVLATQRPSVDIVTGTIKANLPSRIALKVMNFQDSQTILSEAGAEKLLGNGDMLYRNSGMSSSERYQGAWISDREINNIVTYIKEHNQAYFNDELSEFLEKETRPRTEETSNIGEEGGEKEFDKLFVEALSLAVNTQSVSISQLQRRFQIGYARAGGIVDKMERYGFISGNEGSKARRVLITREEFEEKFGPMEEGY